MKTQTIKTIKPLDKPKTTSAQILEEWNKGKDYIRFNYRSKNHVINAMWRRWRAAHSINNAWQHLQDYQAGRVDWVHRPTKPAAYLYWHYEVGLSNGVIQTLARTMNY